MDPSNKRRYVPAPAPPARIDTRKRLQLRLELHRPTDFARQADSDIRDLARKSRERDRGPEGELAVRDEASELENSLREFQKELAQKERELRDKELRLEETLQLINRRATELAEARRLLTKQKLAYETGITAKNTVESEESSSKHMQALENLRLKIEQQSRTLEEGKEWLHEREAFVEESEKILFQKMQAQQERETELDQREEVLDHREARVERVRAELAAQLDDLPHDESLPKPPGHPDAD